MYFMIFICLIILKIIFIKFYGYVLLDQFVLPQKSWKQLKIVYHYNKH